MLVHNNTVFFKLKKRNFSTVQLSTSTVQLNASIVQLNENAKTPSIY